MIGLRSTMSGMAAPSHIAARATSRGALWRAANARWSSAMASRFQPPPVERVEPYRAAPRVSPPWIAGRAHRSRAPEPPHRQSHALRRARRAAHAREDLQGARRLRAEPWRSAPLPDPRLGQFLKSLGVVVGSRERCPRLKEEGAHVLVFPGGGREVTKRKGEACKLIWNERTGFARTAIEHGYMERAPAVDLARQTDVAVVEADHPARPISPEQLRATRRVPDENVSFRVGLVRDADRLSDRLRLLEHAKHQVGDVGA